MKPKTRLSLEQKTQIRFCNVKHLKLKSHDICEPLNGEIGTFLIILETGKQWLKLIIQVDPCPICGPHACTLYLIWSHVIYRSLLHNLWIRRESQRPLSGPLPLLHKSLFVNFLSKLGYLVTLQYCPFVGEEVKENSCGILEYMLYFFNKVTLPLPLKLQKASPQWTEFKSPVFGKMV